MQTSNVLSEDFLAPYKTKEPPFGVLGLITFYRTYSRFLPEEGRRERWWEVVRRVVEYSVRLVDRKFIAPGEPEELYDAVFNLRVFPAGRTLWVGNTPVVEKDGVANFNCAFRVIDGLEAFSESLYLLMNGCGVGFSVEQQYVDCLPQFRTDVEIEHAPYQYFQFSDELSDRARLYDKSYTDEPNHLYVGDSKEGWRDALLYFLQFHVAGTSKKLRIIYDDVRPAGTPLKTFGGRASGHEPLKYAFTRISEIICKSGGKLTAVNVMDIETIIASVVVVGGVRRSSLIALGDIDDNDFAEAKLNLFTDPAKAEYRSNRVMSNNSLMLHEIPSVDYFEERLKIAFDNGEPAFINAKTAKARRPDFQGVNPCAEILLRNRGLCNLTEINVEAHRQDDRINKELLAKSLYLATRHNSRITEVKIQHPDWHRTQQEDRLLGVSLTGIMTAMDALSGTEEVSNLEDLFQFARKEVRKVADEYHGERGIPRSILTTCIKPSGTLSLLPGVSPGIHRDYAPQYIRRIRVSKHDPVAKALTMLGFKAMPENFQGKDYFDNLYASINHKLERGEKITGERRAIEEGLEALRKLGVKEIPQEPTDKAYIQWDICKTKVFSFVVKTNAKIRATDEPAIDQLNRYKLSMQHYTEHNTSVTITFRKEEIPAIAQWLYDNHEFYVGVSFLPVYSPYLQAPYEACTEEEYEKRRVNAISEDDLAPLIAAFETGEEWDVDGDCVGGCPVR